MKTTPLDYLFIPVFSHSYSSLLMLREDFLFCSFFHVHCIWACHWASLKKSVFLHPPFSFTLMRYALSLLFSRLNSPNSQPLLSSTVLRRSLERHNKRWSVWAESGGELIEWLQRGSMSATEVGTKGKLRFLFLPSVLFPASCLWEDNLGFTEQGERGNI